jgi:hypothetical protein
LLSVVVSSSIAIVDVHSSSAYQILVHMLKFRF